MAYFANMPVVSYPLTVNGKVKFIDSRNIMVRAKFLDYIKSTQSAYMDYTIRDGERPETLARRIYGQSDMHWIVLLFNEILDPLFHWPLSTYDLEAAVNTKYTGKALFIDLNSVQYKKDGVMTRAKEELWYEIGSTVSQVVGGRTVTATVIGWDPDLYKIIIDDPTGSFTVDRTALNLVHTRSDGVILYAGVGKVVDDNRYAVHHFIDVDTGKRVDHHALFRTGTDQVLESNLIIRYAVYGNETETILGKTYASVTNYQHEIEENESRRKIKLMRPELIDVVIKDMRKVFGG
jgi:hypothetical protein